MGGIARQILEDLGKARLHLPTLEDVLAASLLSERYRLAFWNTLVLQSAKALGARGSSPRLLRRGASEKPLYVIP